MTKDREADTSSELSSGTRRVAVLTLRGRDVMLPTGKYFIGRSASCHLVIDDARVSRRHARIDVYRDEVSITDLGSSNGMRINGKQVSEGPYRLSDGDMIGIGHENLRLRLREKSADSRTREPTVADVGLASSPPMLSSDLEADSAGSTRLQEGAGLVLEVAERAILAGDAAEAENVARNFLLNALKGATAGREAMPGTYSLATTFGLRLARATGKGEWLDYVVDMLRARRVQCSEELGARLKRLVKQVDTVDVARLERYHDSLREGSTSLETLRAANVVADIIRTARRRP
jgi:pSer/pThr/pTyr-binding forkhead associated (FHA) protein